MRRVFVIRKDLNLKPGKLAAMVGHCAEAYFTNMLVVQSLLPHRFCDNEFETLLAADPYHPDQPALYRHPAIYEASKEAFKKGEKTFKWKREVNARPTVSVTVEIPKDIWEGYINDIFTKTICECKNLNQLKTKIEPIAEELNLVPLVDWGYINDKCLTDLKPENEDGTTTIGAWFKPLPDEQAHMISKKFKLYGAFDK